MHIFTTFSLSLASGLKLASRSWFEWETLECFSLSRSLNFSEKSCFDETSKSFSPKLPEVLSVTFSHSIEITLSCSRE